MRYPWNLDYWNSGEWQVVNERLHDMEKKGDQYNPGRSNLFASLRSCSLTSVRCVLVGQDPYPQSRYATGLAFSIPRHIGRSGFPPTLRELLSEYSRDLGYGIPSHGDLSSWAEQGVLLWNTIPSCSDGRSLSHDWEEYRYLNREVFSKVSQRGVVFALLGGIARRDADAISSNSRIITTSHPSPRGSANSRTPFNGSRLFSTINLHLNELALEPIDWRLDAPSSQSDVPSPTVVGNRVLQNTTGADLGGHPRPPERNLYSSTFNL